MLDELAKAVHGTVHGDVIYTDKGIIRCSISGTVWMFEARTKGLVELGKMKQGVIALTAAYVRAP